MLGQYGKRRVIAHGAHGLLAILDHRVQHHFEVFHRQGGGKLAPAKFRFVLKHARLGSRPDDGIKLDDVFRPVLEVVGGRELILDLAVVVEATLLEIDAYHLARADPALSRDVGFMQDDHSGFGTHEEQAILGDRVAQRPEAVAIKTCDDPAPVGDGQCRWSVPRLHHGVGILVHGPVGFRHGALVLRPRLGYQERLGHGRRTTGAAEHLEYGIQRGRVRRAWLYDRLYVFLVVAEGLIGHPHFMALHPVGVSLDRVDLAVMGDHPKGMGEIPGRERVR